jgi:hypothetical protein
LVVERQTAASQNDLMPLPASEVMMLFLSASLLALVALASVSKTAMPTVTATPSLV